jgi:hypothetical protein
VLGNILIIFFRGKINCLCFKLISNISIGPYNSTKYNGCDKNRGIYLKSTTNRVYSKDFIIIYILFIFNLICISII